MTNPVFRSIYFDCDSTLSTIEGIDELARDAAPDVRDRITRLTDAAMDGTVPMADVYGQRLEIMRPSRDALARITQSYIDHLVPDAVEVVRALRFLGKHVGVVSGGLLPAVRGLADHLEIEPSRVHAVDIRFSEAGDYAGFETDSPLARNGGKPELLAKLADADRPIALVGDGVTDLEAASVVDRFIGFGGVARRAKVVAGAEHYADGPSLRDVLQFCLSPAERIQLAEHSAFADLIE